eukprot:scaffold256045_cov14-Tisochrysis_lutea.AAC.1
MASALSLHLSVLVSQCPAYSRKGNQPLFAPKAEKYEVSIVCTGCTLLLTPRPSCDLRCTTLYIFKEAASQKPMMSSCTPL